MQLHRNSQKRFEFEGAVYFVTCCTQNFEPWFKNFKFGGIWLDTIIKCRQYKQFKLYGFCLNHYHFHLKIKPNNEYNISKIMKSLKENSSRDINKQLVQNEGE